MLKNLERGNTVTPESGLHMRSDYTDWDSPAGKQMDERAMLLFRQNTIKLWNLVDVKSLYGF